jgi:hypothetical protein
MDTGAALDLAHQLTRHSAAARITAMAALEHPFLSSGGSTEARDQRECSASATRRLKRKSQSELKRPSM